MQQEQGGLKERAGVQRHQMGTKYRHRRAFLDESDVSCPFHPAWRCVKLGQISWPWPAMDPHHQQERAGVRWKTMTELEGEPPGWAGESIQAVVAKSLFRLISEAQGFPKGRRISARLRER